TRQHGHAVHQPLLVDVHLEVTYLAVGADHERGVCHAQEARPFAGPAHGDERRNFQVAGGQLVGDHGPVAGVLHVGVGHVAGMHVVPAAAVVGLAGGHAADDGHVVHVLGHHRHVF